MNHLPRKRRVLIVGEGRETEYNYFVGFRKACETELEASAISIRVVRGKGGDARGIVQHAIKEAKKFRPDRKFGDLVFLLMDTEGAGRAPELPQAEHLANKNRVEIVYSSPAFEYWLLCHFPRAPRRDFKDCDAVIAVLDQKWASVCIARYDKADQDVFDRLNHLLGVARAQALEIDLHHSRRGTTPRGQNPSTQVYELIAILIGARTTEKCPMTGRWQLVGVDSVAIELNKGDK